MTATLAGRATAALTAGLHLVALWLYVSSGLLAPFWAVTALLVLWVLLAWVAVLVHRRHGALALLVPVTAIALWFGAITAGEQLLGWTG